MKLCGGQVCVRMSEDQILQVRALARLYGSTPAGVLRRALRREWDASKQKAEKAVKLFEEIDE